MILGKSFNYDFNLFVYKMRGSGYMVPMISLLALWFHHLLMVRHQLQNVLLKGDDLHFEMRPMGLFSALSSCHSMKEFLRVWFPCCFGTFCTHFIAFARPISRSVFPQSLKTGHCRQRFLSCPAPQPFSPNKTHGGLH